jgi:hypothetical protein
MKTLRRLTFLNSLQRIIKNMAVARDLRAEATLATLVLGSGMMCDYRLWKNG